MRSLLLITSFLFCWFLTACSATTSTSSTNSTQLYFYGYGGKPTCKKWDSPEFWENATYSLVKECLDAGESADIIWQGGATPLYMAVYNTKDLNILNLLVENGADVNLLLEEVAKTYDVVSVMHTVALKFISAPAHSPEFIDAEANPHPSQIFQKSLHYSL